ncbi:MAG: helix-turn-helix domain-containing protein [Firmicutes bacterium]|nr:helix-turn-helix domain-containing protein [Candidatus Fermentithermobacillaceae bacterium]
MTKAEQQARRQQWQQWIAEYRASGLSAREWCASRGVKPDRLWYWLRRFRTEEESGSTKWLPVDLSGVETKGQPEGGCLVVRVGKAAVEVRPGFDPELLLAVVRVLSAAC